MTDILCKWLNEDVCLEQKLTKSSFPDLFSNGYLFGEVLHKHGLQHDFDQFSNGKSSEAKLNNFMRLEPTFKLLEIPFNINMARDVMTEKPGVATRLMYQLFVALNRVKESHVTGQSLETMRPSGRVKLEKIETGIFQKRLKQQTPRQVDLNFEGLIQKFQERQKSFEDKVSNERQMDEERIQHERRQLCHKSLEKSHEVRERQAQLYAKLKPLSPSKPSPRATGSRSRTAGAIASDKSRARRETEANATRESINAFEATLKSAPASLGVERRPASTGSNGGPSQTITSTEMAVCKGPSSDYVSQIRRRVQDNELARKEREKRRRKVLVEQMQALQEQENIKREKMLVERLMRQCQQERRVATQLMAIRKEKDTIRNNRIHILQQYEEQRIREFDEAMDRERELARCEAQEVADKLKHHQQLYKENLKLKAEQNYYKNYQLCQDVLLHMVDFACKMAEYKTLTKGLVPGKLVCDWKTLFVAGKSLYDDLPPPPVVQSCTETLQDSSMASTTASALKKTNNQLLDEADIQEYKSAICEWSPPSHMSNDLPRPPNTILCHIVYRLLDMVDPPKAPPTPPSFPKFLIRASFVGKPFSGKSTIIQQLEQECDLVTVLNPETLITKAVGTYLSEKRLLDSQLSTDIGDDPENDPRQTTPVISVDPSSSVNVITSSVEPLSQDCVEEGGLGSSTTINSQLMAQLSQLGQLGHKAHVAMVNGESLDDETVIDILVNEMRVLPDGSSWLLDNYPSTLEQAKLLATALTGVAKASPDLPREFSLIPERTDHSHDLGAASGLDMIVLFNVSTDNALLRASQEAYPQSSNKLEQIQHRLLSFESQWPPMRRWYQRFRNLSVIDANQSYDSLYDVVQGKVLEAVHKAKHSDAIKKLGAITEGSALTLTGSASDLSSPPKVKSPKRAVKTSPARRRRRPSSAGSLTPSMIAGLVKLSSSVNMQSEPGGTDWEFCNLPLKLVLAQGLAQRWPSLETTYLTTLKSVFQLLREERENICHYFYEKSCEFTNYLTRPDAKQEFVSQWQTSYNSLSPHLRREDLMKAELHHRVDDLCEKLWDISDGRREGGEQERQRVLSDHWLDDHIGLLTNHYIALMQAEIDRFYDTYLLLKDYYSGMEEKVPAKLPDSGRLPFIELCPTVPQDLPPSNTASMQNVHESTSSHEEGTSSVEQTPKRDSSTKQRVPILPRQALPEPTEDKAPKKKGGGAAPMTPPPPTEDTNGLELDQQLVVHAYNTAVAFVFNTSVHDVKSLETVIADLSKPPPSAKPPDQPQPPEPKEEKAAKGKKDKAKSPAGKKGKVSPGKPAKGAPPPPDPVPDTPAPSLSPEDVAKKQVTLFMHREHKAALQQEENRVKLRLELIKQKSLEQIENMKAKGQTLNNEMEQWLGEAYKQEVECVTNLADILRQAIENEEKLINEIVLPGTVINIKDSVLVFLPSPPPSPPPSVEPTHPQTFTVNQLLDLHTQLRALSPSGFMLATSLVDTLQSFIERTVDGNTLPDQWTTMNREQLVSVCDLIYGTEADVVDWRTFLVCVAQPWTQPTAQQLLDTLRLYKSVGKDGWINKEQYMSTGHWLDESGDSRDQRLKQVFYEIFCDESTGSLSYLNMLFYLCADPRPGEGLVKALSLVTEELVSLECGVTVTLEDMYKAVSHGVYTEDSQTTVTMGDLFELFRSLSPSNPNEVRVSELISNKAAWDYITSATNYHITWS